MLYDACVCWLGILNVMLPSVSVITLSLLRLICVNKPLMVVRAKRLHILNTLVREFGIGISIHLMLCFGSIDFAYHVSSCITLLVKDGVLVPSYSFGILIADFIVTALNVLVVAYIWINFLTRKHLPRKVKYSVAESTSCSLEEARKQTNKEKSRK